MYTANSAHFFHLCSVTQDLSLYVEFTIRETFLYFGWINGMKTEDIEEKLHFLVEFLQLPTPESFVKNLRLEPSVVCQ
jgi:ABC-type Na+ transport system ATPase subunit NatA